MQDTIVIIAKKEFLANIRNNWLLFASTLFALLATVVSALGSFGQGWQDFRHTIYQVLPLMQPLLPLLGLLLGYGAITGEIERGSMNALLALPTSRTEIVLGKFLGLSAVLSSAMILGFGCAGLLIALNVAELNLAYYGVFIAASMLTGIVFVGVSILLSVFFVQRTTAIGGAIFFWFFFFILFELILNSVTIVIVGLDTLVNSVPGWYYSVKLLNPLFTYSTMIEVSVPTTSTTQTLFGGDYPAFFSTGLLAGLLLTFTVVCLVIAVILFQRRDI